MNFGQHLTADQKNIFVEKAVALRNQENYKAAISQLDSILKHNTEDAKILLFKGDLSLQANLFDQAINTYKKLLPLNFETTTARINISYALFMAHKPGKALGFAQMAFEKDSLNKNAIINYFNAMLWNLKTKNAGDFLEDQKKQLNPNQVLILKARLNTSSGNYKAGLQNYDSLLVNHPNKDYIKEYTEVLIGKKEMATATNIFKAKDSLFNQNETFAFNQKIKASKLQNSGLEFVYFKDIANNVRIEKSVWWQQGEGQILRLRLSLGNATITSAEHLKTQSQFINIAVNERWNATWSGETLAHLQKIKISNNQSFSGLTGRQTLQFQPNDRRMVGISLSSEILNFTASLLEKNIRSQNLGYVTHVMFSGKTGFYSQGSYSSLTDKNTRKQFFGSVYHLFRTEPTLKAGFNFSALNFEKRTENYFAPSQYKSQEIFIDFGTASSSKYFVLAQAAIGLQKIETQKWQNSGRIQAEAGYKTKHVDASIKYQTSNTASASGAGYSFNWYTARVLFKW